MKQAILFTVALTVQASASFHSIRGTESSASQQSDLRDRDVASSIHRMLRKRIHHTQDTIVVDNSSVNNHKSSIGDTNWRTLTSEDFNDGMGLFDRGNRSVAYHKKAKDRTGVVRIKGNKRMLASVATSTMKLHESYSNYKVVFSFQGLGIEDADSFCLDYTFDDGASWTESRCWNSCEDFRNNVWYDGEAVQFKAMDVDRLSIRFRCNGENNMDDILIDKVEIQVL
jgi:hypothetical protein